MCTAQIIIILAKISFAGGRIILSKSGNNMALLELLENGISRFKFKVQTERTAFLNSNLKNDKQIRKTDKSTQK
jgi:hypothetical protein